MSSETDDGINVLLMGVLLGTVSLAIAASIREQIQPPFLILFFVPFIIFGAVSLLGLCAKIVGMLFLPSPKRQAHKAPSVPTSSPTQTLTLDEYKQSIRMQEAARNVAKLTQMEQEARQKWKMWYGQKTVDEIRAMSGIDFERFVEALLARLGYRDLRTTKASGDQGADILGETPEGKKIAVQTKRRKSLVGNSAVQELLGAMLFYKCSVGILVASSGFTKSAVALAAKDRRISLWNGSTIMDSIARVFPEIVPPFGWKEFYNEFVKPDTADWWRWNRYRHHFLDGEVT